jgi:hypothetical protein
MKMHSRKRVYTPRLVVFCLLLGVMALSWPAGSANADSKSTLGKFWTDSYGSRALLAFDSDSIYGFKRKLLAKAQPDECFQGVGNPDNLLDIVSGLHLGFYNNYPGDLTEDQKDACLDIPITSFETPDGHAQPKTNQAYVWGLTKFGHNLWFGTIPNTHCLVISGFLDYLGSSLNSSWVCEGGALDFRPPRAFYYDISKKKLVEVTQDILNKSDSDSDRLSGTIGLRSAGSKAQVAFLGGIASGLNSIYGINIFAFNAQTGEYLDSENYSDCTNIRQWRLVNDELYVGVAKKDGTGEIWRWTGKRQGEIFSFETVGVIQGGPAYLTYHEGRLFVSTWPNAVGTQQMSIYMSPLLGSDGKLTAGDRYGWENVWQISNYEPEPSVAYSVGGGALMSYQGYLYWGTMHVPGLSLLVWEELYGAYATDEDAQAALLGTYRPISIFRGKDFGSPTQQVELLYGNANLPRYNPISGWQIGPNNMGQVPEYGLAGINNFFANYTWWMEVFQDQLFVGTMDFSYLIGAEIGDLYEFPEEVVEVAREFFGADLWRFTSSYLPAVPVSLSGVGNYTNYGIRTMVSTEDALYLGTANPMNLMTDPNDDKPEGGWELLKLTK